MRLMSFALTTPQILNRTKTVTRRCGWTFLKPGDLLQAIEKGQGLKKGEHVRRLAVLRVVSVGRQPLSAIGNAYHVDDCRREGFPEMSPAEFIEMFCRSHKGCSPTTIVTRIEFSYEDISRRG